MTSYILISANASKQVIKLKCRRSARCKGLEWQETLQPFIGIDNHVMRGRFHRTLHDSAKDHEGVAMTESNRKTVHEVQGRSFQQVHYQFSLSCVTCNVVIPLSFVSALAYHCKDYFIIHC